MKTTSRTGRWLVAVVVTVVAFGVSLWVGGALMDCLFKIALTRCYKAYAKPSLRKQSLIVARNDDVKVFSGRHVTSCWSVTWR